MSVARGETLGGAGSIGLLPAKERFVRSIREECLDRVIPLRERHLRRTLADFVAPTMANETTKGLGNELIERAPRQRTQGPVRRRKGIGGLLSYYYRAAA